MDGLECNEVSLAATKENKDFRIDSAFYTGIIKKNPVLSYGKIGNYLIKSQYGISQDMNLDGKGYPIEGLENFEGKEGYYVFHAGTALKDGKIVTNGGRVLGVTAKGATLKEARKNAYTATEWIQFENKYMRHDIGKAIDEA